MKPQFYIFTAVLLSVSAGNIIANFKDDRRLEFITKPMLLPVIACLYLTNAPRISPLWIAGLFLSFLGDTLLMFPKLFVFGGISFGVSHLCYTSHILLYCADRGSRLIWAALPLLAVYIAAEAVLFSKIRDGLEKSLHIPYFMYLFVNALTNLSVFAAYLTTGKLIYLLCFTGTLLFFFSDCVLFYGMANPPQKKNLQHVLIMATYIAAQFLLTFAMIF